LSNIIRFEASNTALLDNATALVRCMLLVQAFYSNRIFYFVL